MLAPFDVMGSRHEEGLVSLQEEWDSKAHDWVTWARDPDLDDDFWAYHLESFIALLPPPGRLTLDVACGEGRMARELRRRGYGTVGIDASFAMVRAAAQHEEATGGAVGDAARLPVRTGSVDLVTAFMCLNDLDDLPSAVEEAARVLVPGGHLAIAMLHPFVTARGAGEYFREGTYEAVVERAGRSIAYRGRHRPLGAYAAALRDAGLRIERLDEVADPRVEPPSVKFLQILASRTGSR